MSKLSSFLSPCLLALFLFLRRCVADVGTAAFYAPPYIPTVCYGEDTGEFPPENLFAAAGEAIWDGGAACGRFYTVRCLSSSPRACVAGGSVRVKIVDQGSTLRSPPSRNRTTMVLSLDAYRRIASRRAASVNVEFMESD
ncbi:EG45-like domain containing protein [Curcuma longa]|uniref:EG45-like domain containing protein n=1 Tax=Curcuma longa TaxID=136217 RepID=UPI003D9E1C01